MEEQNKNNEAPDFGQVFEAFGGLPEELNTDAIFDTVVNSEIGKARINAKIEEAQKSAKAQFLETMKTKFGVESEDVKDLDTLQASLNSAYLEKFSGKDKEIRQSLDEVSKQKNEIEGNYNALLKKVENFETEKEQIRAEAIAEYKKDLTLNNAILGTDNLQAFAKNRPELIANDVKNLIAKQGLYIDSEGFLRHDGSQKTKEEPLINAGKKVTINDFVNTYLSENDLIIKSDAKGTGNLELEQSKNPLVFKQLSRYN